MAEVFFGNDTGVYLKVSSRWRRVFSKASVSFFRTMASRITRCQSINFSKIARSIRAMVSLMIPAEWACMIDLVINTKMGLLVICATSNGQSIPWLRLQLPGKGPVFLVIWNWPLHYPCGYNVERRLIYEVSCLMSYLIKIPQSSFFWAQLFIRRSSLTFRGKDTAHGYLKRFLQPVKWAMEQV